MTLSVRSFGKEDAARLRSICHQTAIERPFLPYLDDPRFASALYLDPYLELEAESCFVAEIDGKIVGYVAGTRDATSFQHRYAAHLRRRLPRLLGMHLGGIACGHFRHALSHRLLVRTYLRILLRPAQETADLDRRVDLRRYPAHCHLQVAPEARAKRAGLALMLRFHDYLKARGVTGHHSSIVEEADKAGYSRMLTAMGFQVVHDTVFTARERPALIHPAAWHERVLVRDL